MDWRRLYLFDLLLLGNEADHIEGSEMAGAKRRRKADCRARKTGGISCSRHSYSLHRCPLGEQPIAGPRHQQMKWQWQSKQRRLRKSSRRRRNNFVTATPFRWYWAVVTGWSTTAGSCRPSAQLRDHQYNMALLYTYGTSDDGWTDIIHWIHRAHNNKLIDRHPWACDYSPPCGTVQYSPVSE